MSIVSTYLLVCVVLLDAEIALYIATLLQVFKLKDGEKIFQFKRGFESCILCLDS